MKHRVTINYEPKSHSDALEYATKYLPSYVSNDTHTVAEYDTEVFLYDIRYRDFFFEDEKDAVLFSLRHK